MFRLPIVYLFIMRDQEKLQRILKVKEAFADTDDQGTIDTLLKGLPFTKEEHARFERGLTAESRFADVYSGLPWTVLIHSLDQRQLPAESKMTLQVPDHLAIVQPADINASPTAVLVDTKLASGKKVTLQLREAQIDNLRRYSDAVKLPLTVAIFWEKLKMWTLHTPEQFEPRGTSRKISLESALRNDLSIIFSDSLVSLGVGWRRRTVYDPNAVGFHLHHPSRGYIVEDSLAVDGSTYTSLTEVESGILNHLAPFKATEVIKDGELTRVTSESTDELASKVSSVIYLLLEEFEAFGNESDPHTAFSTFARFKITANLPTRPMLPSAPPPVAKALLEQVFGMRWSDKLTPDSDSVTSG